MNRLPVAAPIILILATACAEGGPTRLTGPDTGSAGQLLHSSLGGRMAVTASSGVSARLMKRAVLLENGDVRIGVQVRCDPADQVLEAFAYISQEGNQSQFSGIPVSCTGKQGRYEVVVRAYPDMPFVRGEAHASVYILLYNPDTGQTQSGGDSQVIEIR